MLNISTFFSDSCCVCRVKAAGLEAFLYAVTYFLLHVIWSYCSNVKLFAVECRPSWRKWIGPIVLIRQPFNAVS